ncbi:hypothetical protein [Streptomyces sp. NBC_01314]|uniref:hypothetical protein n=1 Tax=Streptomyces sp. NBC_01314 TaxID=2903821 RepID=UPI003092D341|nr:hypothetical protein OG622_13185 [Streptomyces sp. NBC_01314]
MSARDLAEPCPFVTTDDDATSEARPPPEQPLPALPVLDTDGQPYALVPGSQLTGRSSPSTSPRTRHSPESQANSMMPNSPNGWSDSPRRNGRHVACTHLPSSAPTPAPWR